MTLLDHLRLFSAVDLAAILFLAVSWAGLGWRIENPRFRRISVTLLMVSHRRDWMKEMVTRQPRMFDAAILGNLRQGTTFFASGCMVAIGGVMALVGNTERVRTVASDLAVEEVPEMVWRVKLLFVLFLLTYGFLKFVWSSRLFGYCAVVMAAVPNDPDHPAAYPRAAKAADINIRAAWNFNRGLRAVYFALGTLAWLLDPLFLIAATLLVDYTIWNREFSSHSRQILLDT